MEKYKNAYEMYYRNIQNKNVKSIRNKNQNIKKLNVNKIVNKITAQCILSAVIISALFGLSFIKDNNVIRIYRTIRMQLNSNITIDEIKKYDYENEYEFLKNRTAECMTYLESIRNQQY
ncbi:hypothetical protein [Clostridium sp. BJN0001]|uniref:hypothetical protein n=1 Tax=Clostridium sp. BJN0001 TaxID=2930219 RepID=UPI001FD03134|nr:hypothetical protein [Clostridium sp. BJN0001]